jgi:hypothetical protein
MAWRVRSEGAPRKPSRPAVDRSGCPEPGILDRSLRSPPPPQRPDERAERCELKLDARLGMRRTMRTLLKLIVTIPLMFVIGCFVEAVVIHSLATPPKSVTDVDSCLAWLKRPGPAWRINSDGEVYYQVWGPTGVSFPSGPSGYTSRGSFIDWSPDVGDIATPPQAFTPGSVREPISLEELRRRR